MAQFTVDLRKFEHRLRPVKLLLTFRFEPCLETLRVDHSHSACTFAWRNQWVKVGRVLILFDLHSFIFGAETYSTDSLITLLSQVCLPANFALVFFSNYIFGALFSNLTLAPFFALRLLVESICGQSLTLHRLNQLNVIEVDLRIDLIRKTIFLLLLILRQCISRISS